MSSLTSQVSAAFKRCLSDGVDIRSVFAKFDLDGSGAIDKHELLTGLHELKVKVTSKEVDLLLPLFDTDKNGDISFDEFFNFYHAEIPEN